MNILKRSLTFIILIIMSGTLIASAALSPLTPPPTGGYDIGMNSILDPGCTPGATDCFVKSAWTLNGNTGTNPATQFMGTTDAQDLVFKTNGTETMRLLTDTNANLPYSSRSKLNVNGAIRTNGFELADQTTGRNIVSEKTYLVEFENTTNQKVKVYWPSFYQVDAVVEITVTGIYNYSNTNGGIKKRIGINARWNGILNMQQSETEYAIGYTRNGYTISDIQRDTTNNQWYFIVANLDNAKNTVGIHLKVTTVNGSSLATQTNITPVYTTDTTVYPQLSRSFMGSNVGIGTTTPTYKLDVSGDINASGSVRAAGIALTSDARYKQNITDITSPLETITHLHPVTYTWNELGISRGGKENILQYGFSAQELETILPSLVETDPAGYKAVNYIGLTPILVEAVKQLNTKVDMAVLATGNTGSTGFFDAMKNWLGSTANGLTEIFADKVKAKRLCVTDNSGSETCITKSQLDALLGNTSSSTESTSDNSDTTEGDTSGSAGTTPDTADSVIPPSDTSGSSDTVSTPVPDTPSNTTETPTETVTE